MKNRKINFIKLGLFLFVATLFLWNCTLENNSYEPENIDLNNVKTVSFKDAIAHFNAKKEKIKQKKNYSKSTENKFEVTPDWNTLEYNEIAYTNAQLTTANSQINRNGQYSSQLYFINVNNHIRNVIFTIWKDEVDQKGNLINGRIYFNDLEGKFIDGYRVENGIFTKRFVVKPQIQKASFFPLFFIQQHNITEEGDCWNTDVLNDFEGGVLNEVVITAEGGGSSSTGAGHSDSYNWYYTYGPGSISYGSYINGATSTGTIGGGGSSSLSSSQVTSAAAAILMAAPIEPDENGKCPEGYTKNNDGLCVDEEEFEWTDEDFIVIETPSKTIDLNKYLKCFENAKSSSSFSLTIYVDQPIPNKTDTWTNDGTLLNPDINVGHTFISLNMSENGVNTTQTFGFYPASGVSPRNPQKNGAWVDDGGHSFDVSAKINLNLNEFQSLINSIKSLGMPTYNLNSMNCTDAAIQICNTQGMSLPDTNGTWLGGGGSNPGNLGQDIRNMSNNNLTYNKSGGSAPASKGNCN
ncbi:hypothetical protein JL193_08820 [Polaribacter batillariae]|uniref:Lipoprotein n=1 Tax=Polaribacter batillariae TaxID=2808900 RepID=A0ABX7STX4_9FLAO|nr:hypothetical protein [Polaribacter batillariae]QTD36268.1 hypothetical protein JL193_08820 [Polaribacter batillariae]